VTEPKRAGWAGGFAACLPGILVIPVTGGCVTAGTQTIVCHER